MDNQSQTIQSRFLAAASAEAIIYTMLAMAGNQIEKALVTFGVTSVIVTSQINKKNRKEDEATKLLFARADAYPGESPELIK